MINGDRNSWTARKKFVSPIPNSYTLRKMVDIQYVGHVKTTQLPQDSVLKSFRGDWLWIWHRIFGIQNGEHNILESQRFSWNFVLQGFWGRWLRIWHRIFGIQNGGSNMVDMKFLNNQPPRKLLSTEFCGNCVVFQNYISDILDIRHLAKGIAIWDRWDKFFLAVQLFWSPLIIVRIKSQYSFGSKKNYEKKNSRFFGTFFQIWRHIGFPTGPNSILTTDSWRARPKLYGNMGFV